MGGLDSSALLYDLVHDHPHRSVIREFADHFYRSLSESVGESSLLSSDLEHLRGVRHLLIYPTLNRLEPQPLLKILP